ncbi:MAG: antitoxin [Actinomycetota bacterium]
MATMYLRNVPEPVRERLARLAEREGMSVSAFAVRELSEIARRADNAALVAALPDLGISVSDVLDDLDEARADR